MIIIQDTREKQPWNFEAYDGVEQVVAKIDAGDYVIQGQEQLIAIDRKKSVSELSINLGAQHQRFARELERMGNFEHRYVICEFPYEKLVMFPKGANLPKHVLKKIRVSGKFLVRRVEELSEKYGVKFLFCMNRMEAQDRAMELICEAIDGES